MNWELLIKSFVTYLKIERSLSENTVYSYKSDLKKISDFFSDVSKSPLEINSIDLKSFISSVSKILSEPSQSRIISSIKSFYKYLLIENLVNEDPSENLVSPKIGKKLPNILTVKEIDSIIKSIEKSQIGIRNKAIIETIYGCGLRVSELTNLKISNLFLKDGYIKIVGKGNKERLSPIGSLAIKSLNDYLKNVRPKLKLKDKYLDYVFINNRGTFLSRSMIFKMIKKYVLISNINKNISPHTLRHSFATHLIEGGANLRVVQEILGHSSITTTEIYTHLDNNYLRTNLIEYHPRA